MAVPSEEVARIFTALGFRVIKEEKELIKVEIPTYRPDIEREIDLVEEVLRVYGYDRLPQLDQLSMSVSEVWNPLFEFMNEVRNFFSGLGFNENFSNSLLSRNQVENGIWSTLPVELTNPLSQEMAFMRSDLIQGLLTNFKYNATRKRQNLRFYELGTIFAANKHIDTGAEESLNLAALICTSMWNLNWNENQKDAGIFYIKGILDSLFNKFEMKSIKYNKKDHPDFRFLYEIKMKKKVIGYLGQYPESFSEKYQMKEPVLVFELKTDPLLKQFDRLKKYRPLSQFPSVNRDISLVLDADIAASKLKNDIISHGGKNLIDIVIYDEYINSKKLGENKRALSFRLRFQHSDRTLVDEDIDPIMEKLFKILDDNHGAQLR